MLGSHKQSRAEVLDLKVLFPEPCAMSSESGAMQKLQGKKKKNLRKRNSEIHIKEEKNI